MKSMFGLLVAVIWVHLSSTQIAGTIPAITSTYQKKISGSAVCDHGIATDLVLMVDISQHTIRQNKDLKDFLIKVLSDLKISDHCVHVGLVAFSGEAKVILPLNTGVNMSIVEKHILDLQPSNEKIARIGRAINYTRGEVYGDNLASRKNQGIKQITVLVSHKSSTDNVTEAAYLLRRKKIRIFTVAVSEANDTQINQIASHPTRNYKIKVKTFSDLLKSTDTLLKKIENDVERDTRSSPKLTHETKLGCQKTDRADIYLLIDGSGSIYPDDFTAMKSFLVDLIDMFDIGSQKVRLGAVQYSDRSQLEIGIGKKYSKIQLKLETRNIRQLGGGTNTGAAINFTCEFILDPANIRKGNVPVYFIVLTDGDSQDSVKEAAMILRENKVNMFAIGVKEANQTQLLEITGDPKRVHYVNNFDSLKDIKILLAQQICSSEVCHKVQADVMFLVDSSGSIGTDNFNKMKNFMKSLVNKTDIGPDNLQFGIVQFSNDSMEVLQLRKDRTKAIIWDAIDKMGYMAQGSYTGKALEFVSQYFTEIKGARPKVKKLLILITDGKAQDDIKLQSAALRNSDVSIISMGIFNADKTQLEEISGPTGQVHYAESFETLKFEEQKLLADICKEDCPRIQQADIVFVIDTSSSITPDQAKIIQSFVISFVNKSDVAPDKVQFGALKYADDPYKMFNLNRYRNKNDVITAIEGDKQSGINTYTAKALEFSKTFFTEKQGSRQRRGVPQYLLIITDGESHDKHNLNEASKQLHDAGIIVNAIGVGEAQTEELKTMAGSTGKWFFIKEFEELKDIFVNISEVVCEKSACNKELDISFLIDGSGSIKQADFEKIKDFMVSVVDDFDIGLGKVHVGVAQYNDSFRTEFQLKTYLDKETLKLMIKNITRMKGGTLTGNALKHTDYALLSPASNSRINEKIQQILIVITDGNSQDEVATPAEALRDKGIITYALGVGKVSKTQLLQIAGRSERQFSVHNYDAIKSIKKRMVEDICVQRPAENCSLDFIVGFDISTSPSGASLFHGQNLLGVRIANILNSMMNLRSVSCAPGAVPQISVAFYVPNAATPITPHFRTYSSDLAQNLQTISVQGPSYLTTSVLQSMWKTFQKGDAEKAKMILIFTDGLDENVEDIEKTAEDLRKLGLNGLVTVALEGTKGYDDIKYIEFGRGFEYYNQMHIGMSDIESRLARQMSHVNEKTCCCVFCECIGLRGAPGTYGGRGRKGSTGLKGHQGYRGEQGMDGERGLPGSMGERGDIGCPGTKGPKGNRGLPGDKNEHGEHGLDGLNGEEGLSGPPGKRGEKGEIGDQGKSGIRGAKGYKGLEGQKGAIGDPGERSTIVGPTGPKGELGMEGDPGVDGIPGQPGTVGSDSLPGRRGVPGPPGIKGDLGVPGAAGEQGFRGPQGQLGIQGIKGDEGRNGLEGLLGPIGPPGGVGDRGNSGKKGKKGEPGDPGVKGNPGEVGNRGFMGESGKNGVGARGRKGKKGSQGTQGVIGFKGQPGEPGVVGERGKNGEKGQSSFPDKGAVGDPGLPGGPGRRGQKGIQGQTEQSPCELIDFIRNTCPCCQGKKTCPVYPTELVFALDMSSDVRLPVFKRMINMVTYLLTNVTIRGSNCPVGARVAVMSYNKLTNYLVRFSDFQNKEKLMNAVNNISLESSRNSRDIGACMRFVARNVFKRSLQGATVRRIAVFFSNGRTDDPAALSTAAMEYNALEIIPAVISFTPAPAIKRAFEIDDSGTFQLIEISANDFKPQIQTFLTCTLCYDTCKPDVMCGESNSAPKIVPMDVGLLLDSSFNMNLDEYEAARSFISTLIDGLDIPNTGARVALVSSATPGSSLGNEQKPYLEFDFSTYSNAKIMKRHLQESNHPLQNPPAFGNTLKWMLENIMSKTPDLKKNKAIIMILSGETSDWDKQTLREVSLEAKCKGFALFVLFIGRTYNNTELMELPSAPTEHHLLQLGEVHKPNFEYAARFTRAFLNSVKLSINKYPPPELKSKCSSLNNSRKKRLVMKQLVPTNKSSGRPKNTSDSISGKLPAYI
ncbi:collagen alpha-6(VI) chain-like isoform X1 [Bufo gargarizans]|uniref:collagen alpha-6(VI) chain-like isoform X1 n=1 Tax=Bufo gargarizans TaxID=30331 RepID=UPI001CF5BE2C|nr:collagen alpha-6(VI) chain-like isoform X1 [Bufo gargarizans]XP_044148780.1 collagen alpha-6(VI) chain-like isoform X1 [Bufo gargarizans]